MNSAGFLFGKFLLGFVFVLGLGFPIGQGYAGNGFCGGGLCGLVGILYWMGVRQGGDPILTE